jgi:hypothetical protein
VEQITAMTNLAVRAPSGTNGYPPLSGLFLCPPDTPGETLAQSVAGWVPEARPILLPQGLPGGNFATIGAAGPPFPFAMTLAAGFKVTVPWGFFLRAIVVCAAGVAAPGPGAASFGTLTALATFEADDRCNDRV